MAIKENIFEKIVEVSAVFNYYSKGDSGSKIGSATKFIIKSFN